MGWFSIPVRQSGILVIKWYNFHMENVDHRGALADAIRTKTATYLRSICDIQTDGQCGMRSLDLSMRSENPMDFTAELACTVPVADCPGQTHMELAAQDAIIEQLFADTE